MNAVYLARKIAHEEGVQPASNELVDYVIWEHTGWPGFFMKPDWLEEFKEQLHLAFKAIKQETSDGNSTT